MWTRLERDWRLRAGRNFRTNRKLKFPRTTISCAKAFWRTVCFHRRRVVTVTIQMWDLVLHTIFALPCVWHFVEWHFIKWHFTDVTICWMMLCQHSITIKEKKKKRKIMAPWWFVSVNEAQVKSSESRTLCTEQAACYWTLSIFNITLLLNLYYAICKPDRDWLRERERLLKLKDFN